MHSATSTDPFPLLVELPPAGDGGVADALGDLRAHAFEQAYHAGFEEGRREGIARGEIDGLAGVAARAEAVLAAIAEAADAHRAETDRTAASLGASLVDAALQIAEAVLGHELSVADAPGRAALERALRVAPDHGHLVARLHPSDALLIDVGTVAGATGRRSVEVVADPSVEPGGCVLDTPTGSVDALLSTALERVRAALAGTDDDLDDDQIQDEVAA